MRDPTSAATARRTRRSPLVALSTAILLLAGMLVSTLTLSASAARAAAANTAVTTYRNDNARDGQYSTETQLTQSNVNSTQFGKRVQYPVDGQVYGQPLYLPNVTIGGSVHDVVYATTENDTVYAFDADATSAGAPLWKTSLLPSGATAVSNSVTGCGDLQPIIGITGTPAIDSSTNTMYVVSYDSEGGNEVYRLHALDVTTGQDKVPPIVIQATIPGTGAGSVNGMLSFDPKTERQRVGLVLANGRVYLAFSSFCDIGNYHGWILAYSNSGTALSLANAYTDTTNGSQGGIWGGDGALVADSTGANLYYMSGNGTFDANTGGQDMGDSFVRLNGSLQRQDYFTPFNEQCLSNADLDLGAGGPLLIQGSNALIGGGKEGRIYVVGTANMGGYTADSALTCGGTEESRTDVDKIQQELAPGTVGAIFSVPAFWNGNGQQDVYITSENGPTSEFSWSGGKLSTTPTSKTTANGGDPVVSSNGTTAGTGIVWNLDSGAVLRAYDPTNLTHEYYDSQQNASRDGVSGYVKFSSVVVTNGEVIAGLSSSVAIFGLLGTSPPPPPPPGGFQVNSGGPAVGTWSADQDVTGGTTVTNTKTVDLTGVTNPAPEAVYQSNRFGNFTYSFGGLTAGSSQTVRLHFAETYWTAVGSRIFDVSVNGTQMLTNFDIISAAGAANKAVIEQFTANADSGGRVTIQFATVKDNAQVNGIEVLPSNSPPPPPPASVLINSGGPAVGTWTADADGTGGTAVTTTKTVDLTGVANPAPEAVYQTNRFGNFTYTISGYTAGQSKTIRLHFAETYWTAVGSRIFNVVINGTQVLTNFDIVSAAGAANKAVIEQFTANADSSGKFTIQFVTVKDNAQVNGIEID